MTRSLINDENLTRNQFNINNINNVKDVRHHYETETPNYKKKFDKYRSIKILRTLQKLHLRLKPRPQNHEKLH